MSFFNRFSPEVRASALNFYNRLGSQFVRGVSYLSLYMLVLHYAVFSLTVLSRFIKSQPLPDKEDVPVSLEATLLCVIYDWMLRRDISTSWYQDYIKDVLFALFFCLGASIMGTVLRAIRGHLKL